MPSPASVSRSPWRQRELSVRLCRSRHGAGPALRRGVGRQGEAAAAEGQWRFLPTRSISQRARVTPEGVMATLCQGQGVLGAKGGALPGRRGCAGHSRDTAQPLGSGGPPEGRASAPGWCISGGLVLPGCPWVWKLPRAAAQRWLVGAFA